MRNSELCYFIRNNVVLKCGGWARIIVMDAIYTAVFDKVIACCQGGGYAIIDSSEFFDVMPDDGQRTVERLEDALKFLQKNGCIDIKYARGNVYCVCALKNSLPEGQSLQERSATTVIEVKEKLSKKCLFLYSFASFLGGALGGVFIILAAVL